MPRLTEREKRWQAEDDANILAQAEVIKKDEKRLNRAETAAERIAKEANDRANAMNKIAGKGGTSTPVRRTMRKKRPSPGRPANKHNVFKRI